MPRRATAAQFKRALEIIGSPRGRLFHFLQAHHSARGRAATMTVLARAAGYTRYSAVHLHYGKLGIRIGGALGIREAHLGLHVEFNGPETLTNKHWILSMRPEFAETLRAANWVR